jgi:hypothetical protein
MAAAHQIVSFPVTDKDGSYSSAHGGTAPHGSIPTSSGGTAKYDAVGFVSLQLMALYDGSDPLVIGTPGSPAQPAVTQNCPGWPKNLSFAKVPPAAVGQDQVDLTSDIATCSALVGQPVIEPPLVKLRTIDNEYTYNSTTNILKWQDFAGSKGNSEQVTLQYVQPGTPATSGTPGLCGAHYNAKNQDKCLITQTVGFTQTGGDPGGGADFGIRAIRLAQ